MVANMSNADFDRTVIAVLCESVEEAIPSEIPDAGVQLMLISDFFVSDSSQDVFRNYLRQYRGFAVTEHMPDYEFDSKSTVQDFIYFVHDYMTTKKYEADLEAKNARIAELEAELNKTRNAAERNFSNLILEIYQLGWHEGETYEDPTSHVELMEKVRELLPENILEMIEQHEAEDLSIAERVENAICAWRSRHSALENWKYGSESGQAGWERQGLVSAEDYQETLKQLYKLKRFLTLTVV